MMKKLTAFIFALACIFGMAGCNSLESSPGKAVPETNLTAGGVMDGLANRPCHDLSANGPVRVADFIQNAENYVVPSLMATNSHKIKVSNQSGTSVVAYLFSEGGADGPIRQMAVAAHGEGAFDGLTSRFLYAVGIASEEPAKLDITITD